MSKQDSDAIDQQTGNSTGHRKGEPPELNDRALVKLRALFPIEVTVVYEALNPVLFYINDINNNYAELWFYIVIATLSVGGWIYACNVYANRNIIANSVSTIAFWLMAANTTQYLDIEWLFTPFMTLGGWTIVTLLFIFITPLLPHNIYATDTSRPL